MTIIAPCIGTIAASIARKRGHNRRNFRGHLYKKLPRYMINILSI